MSAPTPERRGRFSAENLHGMGLFPFPLHDPDSDDPRAFKKPRWGGWQTTALESTPSQRKTWDQVGFNLGIYLGPSQLVVVDSDSPEAEAWAVANLPKTPWMVGTAHGFHRYYRLAPGAAAPPDNRPMAGLALDVKAHGYVLAPGSSGQCSELTCQAFRVSKGLRMLNSQGLGAMGFGIPGALGACVASGGRRTVCLDGDGGFHMNIQELEVIRRLGLRMS